MRKNRMETTVEVDGKEIKIFVQRPSNQANREAEIIRSSIWTECTSKGIPTKKQLLKKMKEDGDWDDEKNKKEIDLTLEILELEKKLYIGDGKKKPKLSEGRDIAIDIRIKRNELKNLITNKLSLEENSAESLADNAKFDYLVSACTFYEDGRKVYESFDDYNNRSADEIAFSAASELAKMLYNLDGDFEKSLPENKFLTKFGLVNEDLSLIDPKTGHMIDTAGQRIDEQGFLLDEDGQRVDSDGNKIDEEGLYEMTEYENDLLEEPTKKKTTRKTATKKTTTKTESS